MNRKMIALALIGWAGCGGAPGTNSATPTPPSTVDFAQYAAYSLWPCGPNGIAQPASCDGLVRRYVAALANVQVCDPHADSCVRRPVGGHGPGDAFLCNCTMSVGAANTQPADGVLTDFYAIGCTIMCCPCPAPPPP